jgi:hypothetical protein
MKPKIPAGAYPAISVRQPFASLIACGLKDVEFRTWSVQYRGPLLIHAPLTMSPDDDDVCQTIGMSPVRYQSLPRGAFIGVVFLAEILDLDVKDYAFLLLPLMEFDNPVPGKGKTNLFYPSDAEWKALEKQMRDDGFHEMIADLKKSLEEDAD